MFIILQSQILMPQIDGIDPETFEVTQGGIGCTLGNKYALSQLLMFIVYQFRILVEGNYWLTKWLDTDNQLSVVVCNSGFNTAFVGYSS